MIKPFLLHLFCAATLAIPADALAEEVPATAKFDADGIAHSKLARDERDRGPGYTFETDSENPARGVMPYTFQVDDSGKQLEGARVTTEPQPVSDTPSDILFSLNKFSSIAGGSAEQISWPVRVVTFQSVWWGGASANPPAKTWIGKIDLVQGG